MINEDNGRTREEEILEFCRAPRSSREICNFLGKSTIPYLNRTYLQPLVESGKLLLTVPNYASNMQRYVNAENAGLIPTDGAILDCCKVPRTKTEIEQHFGLSHFMAAKHYNPLIESGKLIGNMPGSPKSRWQKFVAADAGMPITTDDILIEFCTVPRSRPEIAERLGMDLKYMRRYIEPLVADGRLKMTKPEMPSSIDQRFFSGDAPVVVLTEEAVLTFCGVPRGRNEVGERFGLKRHNVQKYLNDLVVGEKLKITIPLSPQCWHQKFVRSNVDVRVLSEEALLEFCRASRTKAEITEYFGVSCKATLGKYLEPLMRTGKLRHTIPDQPTNRFQKFVSV